MHNLIIRHASLCTPVGRSARRGAEMQQLLELPDAAVVVSDGIIVYAGEDAKLPEEFLSQGWEEIDAQGKALLPGFVDSHTHLIFGGYRPDEFAWRMKGDSYMSIMERGGGIQSTVNATRTASESDLREKAAWFLRRMAEMGVTTVEAKSGYGLDLATETKMLNVIKSLADDKDQPVQVVTTFMGAHAVPKEYKGRTDEYIDLIINEMLPEVKDKAEFFDIFTEKNVFEIEESRRLLDAAREAGMKLKLHADEIVTLGGAELAAEAGAVSADHLLHISDAGIQAMAEKGVVATLLPLTAFSLKEPYAPARKIIDAGTPLALATDLNPGSCFSGSIPLTFALACIYMNMSPEEALTAITLNGAAAVDRADITGSIEPGKRADMVLLHFDNFRVLPYYVGMNCVETVICGGRITVQNDPLCHRV